MIQLSMFMWIMASIFGYVGFTRGWNKEIISMAGIILGLFALFQFDNTLNTLLSNVPEEQKFFIRAIIFAVIIFFSYQTRALIGNETKKGGEGRDNLQTALLGAIVGFVNGYLIWGSLWYFMHVTNYPLRPYVDAPLAGTTSADFIQSLPLYILGGGPGGDGSLLSAAVIGLFLIVLIII